MRYLVDKVTLSLFSDGIIGVSSAGRTVFFEGGFSYRKHQLSVVGIFG